MKKLLVLILLAAVQFYSCSSVPADKGFRAKKHAVYLSEAQIKSGEVEPPPAAGSAEDLEDLKVLREWQEKRTPEECASAGAESRATLEQFFGNAGIFTTPLPEEVKEFFTRVKDDADITVNFFKNKYKRPRPFHRDKALEPCLGRIGGPAYPSGHATIARVYALVLSELVPERKKEFLERADRAALHRVIGGVHHPSDVENGKKLAEDIYLELMKSPAFRTGLDSMRSRLLK
ncbi:MAG: hypothetical protein COT17_07910 [Elusimicrobia bacterium CG08_land_8_20_14_0_20_51_18]|nr:MAG: hypothetical protein COT17_07910 [Elusimicrobia bacterium CG08_land_8_20_14_0_20_51_18]